MRENSNPLASGTLPKLNALRVIIVMMIALGYASTMPLGPVSAEGQSNPEWFVQLGYDPSWVGIGLLFFLSGFLALRSLRHHNSSIAYLESRFFRNAPLLFVVTLCVILVIFPIFGNHKGTPIETLKTTILYFVGTVTCIRPGEPLPGLLDDAKYMCLIQGSIWTLKWGVLAHIAVAIGHRFQMFANKHIVLSLSLFSILFYICALQVHLTIRPIPGDIVLAAKLGWPFLTGMAVYAFWDDIPSSAPKNLAISAGFMLTASTMYFAEFIPWTKAIDVCLIMSWAWLCITMLKLKSEQLSILNNWPALALAIYLINWPVSQILLFVVPDLSPGQLIAGALPLTFMLSYLAHKMVSERSFTYAKNRSFIVIA